ncbi:Protein phosphatase Slingshot, partial [Zootermopsis nevadensis]
VMFRPHEREETECVIRCTLKEIMMSVDLDEVTSKYIRGRLEEDLDMDLGEFKPFIDQEMLTILGQMDAATEIFDHVYLGSEWNASNLEELQKNGVHHILNVTREIDNFFPGMFNYLNIRVYDDEKTDLLKHWDNTFKYITRARKEGSKVLVHCKMGVSRSASVVIAYAMKAYNWDFKEAFEYVKQKRSCIKPNASFISQLETYQGILDAMKNREKLQRSKSETNLKSPGLVAKAEQRTVCGGSLGKTRQEPLESLACSQVLGSDWTDSSGEELARQGGRPKSWSPDNSATALLFMGNVTAKQDASTSVARSRLETKLPEPRPQDGIPPILPQKETTEAARNYNLNVRMPCGNGQAYSVSQNKVVYLPASCCQEKQCISEVECSSVAEGVVPSVKHRVSELESQNSHPNGTASKKMSLDRKRLVLNLTTHNTVEEGEHTAQSQTKLRPHMLTAVLVKKEIWDPGEKESPTVYAVEHVTPVTSSPPRTPVSQPVVPSNSDCLVWTSSTEVAEKCVHEPLTNKAEDVIFVSELKLVDTDTIERLSAPSVGQDKVGTGNRMLPRKEGDPFSAQLDRVFEREERKQQRVVIPGTVPATNAAECPSRQSSWSSYDSAVVLGDTRWTYSGGGTLPSRNSSWGSYDMRPPMQYVNERGEKYQQPIQTHLDDLFGSSSSGMFPYDRDEIPWYPGTVKRTKQKLEEGTGTVKRVCSEAQQRRSESNDSVGTAPVSTEKMATSQPNITFLNTAAASDRLVEDVISQQSSAISRRTDLDRDSCSAVVVPDSPPHTLCCLSASAPTTSAVSLVEGIESLTPPSHSLPSVSMVCLTPRDLSAAVSCESVSETSPCIISTTQCASVRHQKRVLENLTNVTRRSISVDSSADVTKDTNALPRSPEVMDSQKSVSGLVKNLKKEFEAKSVNKTEKCVITSTELSGSDGDQKRSPDGLKTHSLPSSPVSSHPQCKSSSSPCCVSTTEDLSVKVLVGKYEVSKNTVGHPDSPSLGCRHKFSENETVPRRTSASQQQPPVPLRKSSLEIPYIQNNANKHSSLLVRNLRNGKEGPNARPPTAPHVRSCVGPSPSVVVANVVAKAASKKQQQGKTHPLARLTINKPRHTNSVYNTM